MFIFRDRSSFAYTQTVDLNLSDDLRVRLDAVSAAQRANGIDLAFQGDVATIATGGMSTELPWRWLDRATLARGQLNDGNLGLLNLADRFPPSAVAVARERGIWFADTTGLISVRAPGLVLEVRNRPSAINDRTSILSHRALNPMSPSRAQVVCCLLAWPELVNLGLRTIATASGVSVGVAQQVMADLEARRFLLHGRARLNRVDELLDQWTSAFGVGLGKRLQLGTFAGNPTPAAWLSIGNDVYISGETASDELQGTDLTMYVERLDRRAVIASRWTPSTDHPNITVRRKFWSELELGPGDGRILVAPLPLQLADLLVTDDPRHKLAAVRLREQVLDLHRN